MSLSMSMSKSLELKPETNLSTANVLVCVNIYLSRVESKIASRSKLGASSKPIRDKFTTSGGHRRRGC